MNFYLYIMEHINENIEALLLLLTILLFSFHLIHCGMLATLDLLKLEMNLLALITVDTMVVSVLLYVICILRYVTYQTKIDMYRMHVSLLHLYFRYNVHITPYTPYRTIQCNFF